jgi:putative ABC transport system substrate-binding protein
VRDANTIESALIEAAGTGIDGLLVQLNAITIVHRERLVRLIAAHRLPAIYEDSRFVAAGGLMSYGGDATGNYQRAASYVDRILKGAQPGDLPVEQATRFELVINAPVARALGLTISPALLARADEVIE